MERWEFLLDNERLVGSGIFINRTRLRNNEDAQIFVCSATGLLLTSKVRNLRRRKSSKMQRNYELIVVLDLLL